METSSLPKNEWHFVAAVLPPRNRFAMARTRRSDFKPLRKRCRNQRNNFCHSEPSRGISRMKIRVALVIAFSLLTAALRAEKISLVGATVINPADGKTGRCHARQTGQLRRQIYSAGVHRHTRALLSIGGFVHAARRCRF